MARVEADGLAFNVRVDGPEGAPWIVLSNSLGSTLAMWDDQIDLLTRKYRVLRYDHRGHGGTDVAEGPVTWDQLTDDVVALMDAHGIGQADYMGLSMGLMTGMGLGIRHGDRFGKMVLADGRADAPPAYRAMWDARIAAIEAGGLEAIADAAMEMWLAPDWRAANPERTAALRAMLVATPEAGYVACCRCIRGLDYLKDAGRIGNEVLCVTGSADQGALPEVVQTIAAAIPGARYAEIEGSHHIANIDGRDAFNAVVAEFLGIA